MIAPAMKNPQSGIFALGTSSHAYLEFDASGRHGHELVTAIASLREPRTTMGGREPRRRVPPRAVAVARPGRHAARARRLQRAADRGRRLRDAGHAARRRALAVRRRLRRDLRHGAGGDRGARRTRHDRGGDVELAVPARPRPDRLHRRHREPDAGRGAGVRARARGQPRRGRHGPAAAEVGARRRCLGVASGPGAGARDGPDEARQRRARATSRPTRTSRAPTRTASGTSSAATWRTARSPTTARCSSASPPSSGHSRRCSRAWSGSAAQRPTRSRDSRTRSRGAYYFVPSIESLLDVSG